jgi:hypothetical protein
LAFGKPKVVAELIGGKIIGTMPGTSFRESYERSKDARGVVATSFGGRKDPDGKVTLPMFLECAWQVANEMAREIGWIV